MEQKIAITKYDKPRAKGFFVLFKALELFGVFLLTFGFYGLGCLVHKHFIEFYNVILNDGCASYLCMWWVGLGTFLLLCITLFVAGCIGYAIFSIIQVWIKGNWNMAKRFAEDSDAKAERINQQEVNEKKEQRSKFGYCVGDEVEIVEANEDDKCDEDYEDDGDQFLGKKGEIVEIVGKGHPRVSFDGKHNPLFYKSEIKITKKYPIKIGYAKLGGGKK